MLLEQLGFSKEECISARNNADEFIKEAQNDEATKAYLEALIEKMAFDGVATAKNVGDLLATSALASLGFGAANSLIDHTGKAISSIGAKKRKQQAFNNMLAVNEDLQQADSDRVELAFNTLHSLNPTYAQDPLIASEFVQQVVDSARLPLNAVNDLVRAREGLARAEITPRYIQPDLAKLVMDSEKSNRTPSNRTSNKGRENVPPKANQSNSKGKKKTSSALPLKILRAIDGTMADHQETKKPKKKSKKKVKIASITKKLKDALTAKQLRSAYGNFSTARRLKKLNKQLETNIINVDPKQVEESIKIYNRMGRQDLADGLTASGLVYGSMGAAGALGYKATRKKSKNK